MLNVGLNMFSLRHKMKCREDFLNTALRLRDMGYSFMQFSGAPFDAELIRSVTREAGLPVYLTHVPYDRIVNDTEALMREHESFGCHMIGLGRIDSATVVDESRIYSVIETLERAAARMKSEGFGFFYHNHHTDLYRHRGITVLDYMLENAPSINFTLDTYWLQYGGVSVTEYIRKFSGRIACVHLKDYRIIAEGEGAEIKMRPVFAPVGEGNMNFKAIVPEMKAAGSEYFIVEQDNAPTFPDPLDEVRRSIDYIRAEL